jgi:hypothetical protein
MRDDTPVAISWNDVAVATSREDHRKRQSAPADPRPRQDRVRPRVPEVGKAASIAHQAASGDEVAAFEDRWHRVADGQRGGRGAARGNGGR